MKKKLSILLAAAMILALASCGTGSQTPTGSSSSAGSSSVSSSSSVSGSEAASGSETSSDSASTGESSAASSAASSEEESVMDTLNWTENLPDPGEGIVYMELNDADTVMQLYMDSNWTVESAKAYVARCLEVGFVLNDEAEPAEGVYYSEGYNDEELMGFMITCGFDNADIVFTYGPQMSFY